MRGKIPPDLDEWLDSLRCLTTQLAKQRKPRARNRMSQAARERAIWRRPYYEAGPFAPKRSAPPPARIVGRTPTASGGARSASGKFSPSAGSATTS